MNKTEATVSRTMLEIEPLVNLLSDMLANSPDGENTSSQTQTRPPLPAGDEMIESEDGSRKVKFSDAVTALRGWLRLLDTWTEQANDKHDAELTIEDMLRASLAVFVDNNPGSQVSLELLLTHIKQRAIARSMPTTTSNAYPIHTGEEMDALCTAFADGRTGLRWGNSNQSGVRYHEHWNPNTKKITHRVELLLGVDGMDTFTALEEFTSKQDADGALAIMYVASLCAPPATGEPFHGAPTAIIEIEDVAQKINPNYTVLTAEKRAEHRAKVWEYLRFGAAARVVGARGIKYYSKTNEEISTRLDVPLWQFGATLKPDTFPKDNLFAPDVPVKVEITMSRMWLPLLTDTPVTELLKGGEVIGSIPPDQPSNAWARVIALVLLRLFRIWPREALKQGIYATRRELLTHYTPSVRTVTEILDSSNPKRAVDYWDNAIKTLVDKGIVAPEHEAAAGVAVKRLGKNGQELPSRGWQKDWLDAEVYFAPGKIIRPALIERAESLPPLKPKSLPGKKRPGRPRKNPLVN